MAKKIRFLIVSKLAFNEYFCFFFAINILLIIDTSFVQLTKLAE